MLFGVFVWVLCAQLEHCCIHGKGVSAFFSFLEEITVVYINCFNRLKLEMNIFQAMLIPPAPPPRLFVSFVRYGKGQDGEMDFKACDAAESLVSFSEMRLRGCTSSVISECADLLHLCLFKPYWDTTFRSARPASMLTDRREHEKQWACLIEIHPECSVTRNERDHSCTSINKHHGILRLQRNYYTFCCQECIIYNVFMYLFSLHF